jgi:hypothetical protein
MNNGRRHGGISLFDPKNHIKDPKNNIKDHIRKKEESILPLVVGVEEQRLVSAAAAAVA